LDIKNKKYLISCRGS